MSILLLDFPVTVFINGAVDADLQLLRGGLQGNAVQQWQVCVGWALFVVWGQLWPATDSFAFLST